MEFKLITWLIIIDGFLLGKILMVDGKEFCTNKTSGVQWIKKENTIHWTAYQRYPGEWWKADCRITNLSNVVVAQLLHVKPPSSERKIVQVDGIKLKNNGNVFNLTNVSLSDAGEYYCKVCGEEKLLSGFAIDICGKPFQYPIIVNKPSGPIDFGSDFTLICEVAGVYTLKWWDKDGENKASKIEALNKGTKNYKRRATLEIKKFSKAKEGLYVCKATRSKVDWIATDEVRIKMKDFMKPTFLNFPEDSISLEEGKIFNRTIIVDGSPTPDVDCWEMNKKTENVERSGNSVFIYISKVLYSRDNGTRFQCNASNLNGSIDKVFWLNVLVKPQINGKEQERKKTYSLTSSTLNLPCKIDQANPEPSIEWTYSYKDDENDTKWLPIKSNNGENVRVNESILSVESQREYRVFYKCVARNSEGEDKFTWEVLDERNREGNTSSEKASTSYMIASVVVSAIIFIFILFVIAVLYKRKKRYGGFYIFTLPPPRDYIKSLDSSKSLQEQLHKLPYLTEWEFPRENIFLLSEIGSGAFGVVYLADAVGLASFRPRDILNEKKNQRRFSLGRFRRKNPYSFDQVAVKTAVKTLKDEYNQSELADLHSELKIMIHVGEHENILQILGASTKGDDNKPPLIILEYCPHGNLRQFLRSRRDIYLPEWKEIDNVQLSLTDLITFAFQISKGMDFLISRKCIHRDLAARNVLVGQGYVAKISDFGLARNVYGHLEYVKLTSGLLPLKWMAIEAISDRVFNEKTDVWSYGILLWEIFTLGGTPYPELHPTEVLQTLINGKRMKPPMYCPEEISDMMASTWYENPSERPSFSSIVDDLENLCESKTAEPKLCYQNIPLNDLLHDSQFDDLEV